MWYDLCQNTSMIYLLCTQELFCHQKFFGTKTTDFHRKPKYSIWLYQPQCSSNPTQLCFFWSHIKIKRKQPQCTVTGRHTIDFSNGWFFKAVYALRKSEYIFISSFLQLRILLVLLNSSMSWPTENARPDPVKMITLSWWFSSSSSRTENISVLIFWVTAFIDSGRLRVQIAITSVLSSLIVLYVILMGQSSSYGNWPKHFTSFC